jgi:hypothetical protein
MITLFTTCKPFEGVVAVHQHNAMKSWRRLRPGPTVLVFGNEAKAAPLSGVLYHDATNGHAATPTDEHGLPVLAHMFTVAQNTTADEYVCYVNADIIILDGLNEAAQRLGDEFIYFLGVCRRWDVTLDEALDFGGDWQATVRQRIQDGGELYTPCSSDLFLFRKPLPWGLPPFVAGRPKWDNWMLWAAVEHETPVVDLTEAVTVAHPRHGYGAGGRIGQKAWRGHPSGERNEKLAAEKAFCLKHVQRAGWLWRLTGEGEVVKV